MERQASLEERERFWDEHLREWRSSGLSQAQYCRENNLSSKTFAYWKRKKKAAGGSVRLVEIPMQRQPAGLFPSSFTPFV
jgi:uncharacterized protein with WD repeat